MFGCCVYFHENVLVLSPGMVDPRQFLLDMYLHQNVLVLSPEMFDPQQFVLVF